MSLPIGMTDNVLFTDNNTGNSVTENDLVDLNDDRCPVCSSRVKIEIENVILYKHSRVWGIIKKTGRVIKKCNCKRWIRMPYTMQKVRMA